jgi:uncharacterized protein (TIRG00374 family)
MGQLRWIVGIVISLVALYIAFVGVEWRDVWTALQDANYWLLAPALPLLFVYVLMRAQRWRLLFYPDRRISLLATFGALNIGYMAGAVLPLQLGEIARVYVLSDQQKLKVGRVLSTIAVERLLDVFALLFLLCLLIPFVDLPAVAAVTSIIIAGVFVVPAAIVVAAVRDRPRVEGWAHWAVRRLPERFRDHALGMVHALLDGLSALSNPRVFVTVVFWTFASWMTSSCVVYLVMRAFSLDVPFAAAPFVLIATTLGFFIPSSPGAIGVYHAISVRTLTSVFDVAHDAAVSYTLVVHALYLIPVTALGACFFWWSHLSLRRLQDIEEQAISEVEHTPAPPGDVPMPSEAP